MIDSVVCPECNVQLDLDQTSRIALEERDGRILEIECINGHLFSLHDGVLAARKQPSRYDIFWEIEGIESGLEQMQVGEWCTVRLGKPFEEIDDIRTTCYRAGEGPELLEVRSEARFDKKSPDYFWLLTSGNRSEWGELINVHWTAYGVVPMDLLDIWKENLIFAARQLLAANYRPSVLQSAAAVESFVYSFVKEYLDAEARWQPKTIKNYIDGRSRDSLPLNGVIRVCIQEIMEYPISNRMWTRWKRLRDMRNGLAHGDLKEYFDVPDPDGRPFVDEKARASFAYETAVQFIYDIRYPEMEAN